LKEAEVNDKDGEIAKFLEEWGLYGDKKSFELLTKDRIEKFLVEYKKENTKFKITPINILAIAKAAQSKTKGILLSNFSSTKISSFKFSFLFFILLILFFLVFLNLFEITISFILFIFVLLLPFTHPNLS